MEYIGKADGVDFQHLYIDGSKFEANATKLDAVVLSTPTSSYIIIV